MPDQLKPYLQKIEQALKAGNATEHTHRPALKALLEALDLGVTATNEPKRIACGAPDYVVTRTGLIVGYIEAKDVGKSLAETERSDQMKRYLRSLENLILTDYLEFRWYVNGVARQTASLARLGPGGKLSAEKGGVQAVESLLRSFLDYQPQPINTPHDLAVRMARLTHMVRDIIVAAYEQEQASMLLRSWREAFAKVLIADLGLPDKTPDFADMFAQTLAYGLFTARVMAAAYPPHSPREQGEDALFSPRKRGVGGVFSRQEAQRLIPKSNPFLRDFFYQITGPQLDDEPFAPFVEDLVALLAHTDMEAVLADFGRRTRQEDPVVHFYETFLAAYDPALRETRGVYYTPEPVVSYIVRSVDYLLKTRFNCPEGLADNSIITVPNYDPSQKVKGKNETRKTTQSHKVLILDPATGTATFLYAVIDHIRQQFMRQGNAGMWPGYVKNHLLPRLFGFELLMAPYAVAHFKLSLQLAGRDLSEAQRVQWSYQPAEGERLGIYLTNALAEAHEMTGLPLFTQWVADETNAANEVKLHLPVLVVMGNPPYSGHSANKGNWIDGLLKGKLPDGTKVPSYYEIDGQPLGERNPKWLQDDYVKFIRFGQWRIERSGQGILAFISNNGYLDNPTFRGMRQQLMQSFTDIYILNLHGNSRKKEVSPDGTPDENVFDIQQGVTIGLFVKEPDKKSPSQLHYADLWGLRDHKYTQLFEADVQTTQWKLLVPQSPFYLFVPQDIDLLAEYDNNWSITEIMLLNVLGFQSHRDHFAIAFDQDEMIHRIENLRTPSISNEELQQKYHLSNNRDWNLTVSREKVRKDPNWEAALIRCLYRPFDWRFCYFSYVSMDYPRRELLTHVAGKQNLCLNTVRQTKMTDWKHAIVSDSPTPAVFVEIKDGSSIFPLYLYSNDNGGQKSLFDISPWPPGPEGRVPNLNPAFVAEVERRLGLVFRPHPPTPSPQEGRGSQEQSPPSPLTERGLGGEVSRPFGSETRWRTPPDLWQKLKPLARQMRREPTPATHKLWQHLRDRQLLGLKFRRQHTIDRFIVDFYCREAQLIIEVDGPIHDYSVEEDAIRQEFLESQGFQVLRFSNQAVLETIESVLERIAAAVGPHPPAPSPQEGRGSQEQNPPSPLAERGLGGEVFTPEDIFHYIYALFHSPTYRNRYAEFLKIDFPRVPLTSDAGLFRRLGELGRELVGLHLLESPAVNQFITRYPIPGDNRVEKGYPRYLRPGEPEPGTGRPLADGRVYLNPKQYFEGAPPDVWTFHVGGYQVADKWLKDRRERQLSYDDLTHYQRVFVALKETIRLMAEIDAAIPSWPIK